jgi:hypothetical protein
MKSPPAKSSEGEPKTLSERRSRPHKASKDQRKRGWKSVRRGGCRSGAGRKAAERMDSEEEKEEEAKEEKEAEEDSEEEDMAIGMLDISGTSSIHAGTLRMR